MSREAVRFMAVIVLHHRIVNQSIEVEGAIVTTSSDVIEGASVIDFVELDCDIAGIIGPHGDGTATRRGGVIGP